MLFSIAGHTYKEGPPLTHKGKVKGMSLKEEKLDFWMPFTCMRRTLKDFALLGQIGTDFCTLRLCKAHSGFMIALRKETDHSYNQGR